MQIVLLFLLLSSPKSPNPFSGKKKKKKKQKSFKNLCWERFHYFVLNKMFFLGFLNIKEYANRTLD